MYEKLAATLGQTLRAARERKGCPVEELAWIVGIEEDEYLRMEGGVELPSLLVLCMLSDVLETSPDELLGLRAAIGKPGDPGMH
jgi:transcriptional regulator with XRE-family HTH domain